MYPAKDARELAILLRVSREIDVVGDVTAMVDNPSDLLAWALILSRPDVVAWRAADSSRRYLQVAADRHRAPIRGRVTAVLACEQHREFWNALGLDGLATGDRRTLSVDALSSAWAVMPVTPSPEPASGKRTDDSQPPSPPPPRTPPPG